VRRFTQTIISLKTFLSNCFNYLIINFYEKTTVLILQAYFLYCLSIAKKIMKNIKEDLLNQSYFDGKMLDLWVQQKWSKQVQRPATI
jgi:hypothetical protein